MTKELQFLADTLRSCPGSIYVNPEGTYLFAVVGPEKKLTAVAAPVRNLKEMTEQELEEVLVMALREK